MGPHHRFTFPRLSGFPGASLEFFERQSGVVLPGCQFPGGKRDPGRRIGGPVCTGNGDRSASSIQVSSLFCILQPLLSRFGAWQEAPAPAVLGGRERWRHRAAPRGGRARARQRVPGPGGGRRGRARALTSGAGPAAVTRGGGAARLPGPARAAIHSKGAQPARPPVRSPNPGPAPRRRPRSWAAGAAAARPGKEDAESPRPRGRSSRPGPEGCGPERRPLPPRVPEEVRRRGGCRSPVPAPPLALAAPASRLGVLRAPTPAGP